MTARTFLFMGNGFTRCAHCLEIFNMEVVYMKKLKKQTIKEVVSDGKDIEFSQELADQDDIEAQERSRKADERAKSEK